MANYEYDDNRIKRFIERVYLIKKYIREKEKREEREIKAKQELKFIPAKDLVKISLFSRNPFEKENIFKFNLTKHKMKMDMLNRNLERNRVEYAVRQAALHYTNPKSRLNLSDRDVINDLKRKILKNKQIKESLGNQVCHNRSTDNNNYLHYNSLNKHSAMSERHNCFMKIIKKQNANRYNNTSRIDRSFSLINIGNKKPVKVRNEKSKSRPKSVIRERESENKHEVKIINKPIYTTDINKFILKYDRLKKQMSKEKLSK